MLVSDKVFENLNKQTDASKIDKGINYWKNDKVHIYHVSYQDNLKFSLSSRIQGNIDNYNVNIDIVDGKINKYSCNCKDFEESNNICKHIIATIYAFANSKDYESRFIFANNKKNVNDDMKTKNKPITIDDLRQDPRYWSTYKLINSFVSSNKTVINKDKFNILENNNDEKIIITDFDEKTIKLVPSLKNDKYSKNFSLSFKIASVNSNHLYTLKNLSEFVDNINNESIYKYGVNLCFKHKKEMFDETSQKLIDYIIRYEKVIKYIQKSISYNSYYYKIAELVIDKDNFDDLFDILLNNTVMMHWGSSYYYEVADLDTGLYCFIEKNPNIEFKIKKNKNEYELKSDNSEYIFTSNIKDNYYNFETDNYEYFFYDKVAYRTNRKRFIPILEVLNNINNTENKKILLKKEIFPMFFTYVYPKIKDNIDISLIDSDSIKEYVPKNLNVKIYLDYDKNDNIIAKILFVYGKIEFNPFKEDLNQVITRNFEEENKVLSIVKNSGFKVDFKSGDLLMNNDDQIYHFLENDINNYTEKFEVMVSDKFKSKQIRQPKIGALGVKVENNLLQIDLKNIDFDIEEIKNILSKYKLKKKYHRLKDGSFINLTSNQDMEFLDNLTDGMDIDYKQLSTGKIRVPVYRTIYLEKLLDNFKNTEIDKNDEYKKIINKTLDKEDNENIKPPKKFDNILRTYQKTGFKWLKILDDYKFGGILADDMGLGKTLQIITIIASYIENINKNQKKASLVVCPSSLVLNWQNEFDKFSPNIKTLAMTGKAEERKEKIKAIDKYNVIITSYDLLKRDIDYYTELNYSFKYVIADEAQYIKNSNTQNAAALKNINAETRYALTGTPIENSLSELWSIFDYILPGYLFSYSKFKKNYETPIVKQKNIEKLKKLKILIQPFILRRVKSEVLTELPDKTITVIDNEMTDEQQKIYLSYLAKAKFEVKQEIENNEFEKNHIKILALLTRLRQICCHPAMFLQNYSGGSSKLIQCIELIKEAIDSGHKILLFSQFTSMLDIIGKSLNEEKIEYYKLIGSTKVEERIKLVDDFNKNDKVKVFLISLKAGGTGLNLTGADVVIHYDPWWNISAENQATDRTYRIGQKNNVQVYKLITKNSIEEKINELQKNKSKLIDNMLNTNQTFISRLSKEDIMKLFN